MSKEIVIEALKVVLADSFVLYLKTQNYHWNVEGPHFKEVHELLEEHYTDLASAIDEIAEQIRTLGIKAPGTWSEYEAITNISDGNSDFDWKAMVNDLVEDQEKIIKSLLKGIEAAEKTSDYVISDIFTQRIAVHRKNHWMLNSMLK